MLLDSITLIISVKTGNHEAAHNAVSSSLMLLPFSSVLPSETLSIYAFPLEDKLSYPNKRRGKVYPNLYIFKLKTGGQRDSEV
jgi:hypothetical protein